MTLSELTPPERWRALIGPGLTLQIGPFAVRISTAFQSVADHLSSLYGDFPVLKQDSGHFAIDLRPPRWLRRYVRPQAQFRVNGRTPFNSVPARLAHGMLEGGVNWSIGTLAHQWIVVHAAVVERDGRAVILPAAPGSGKSTLCAALAFAGWRLLSDEFALIDPRTGEVLPLPRPIALKGPSVGIIGSRVPSPRFGATLTDLGKGTARHLAPPQDAVNRQHVRARARWVIVPRWEPDVPLTLESTGRARMAAHLADSSFNYNMVGPAGFHRLTELVDGSECYTLTYTNLDEAVARFDRLATGAVGVHPGGAAS